MKLKLVKHGEFLGTTCDFYLDEENNIYMSRTQIGYALQYKQPQHAILMVHQRHKESRHLVLRMRKRFWNIWISSIQELIIR